MNFHIIMNVEPPGSVLAAGSRVSFSGSDRLLCRNKLNVIKKQAALDSFTGVWRFLHGDDYR